MKRIIAFSMVVLGLATTACIKETPSTPVEENINLVEMTFTAGTADATKVAFDEGLNLKWQTNDQIKVVTANTAKPFTATSINGNIADFTGWTEAEASEYYAVYPAVAVPSENYWIETGKLSVTIPATQTAVDGSFDPKAYVATAKAEGNDFSFNGLISAIKFQIGNDASKIDRVVFCGKDSKGVYQALAGEGYVSTENLSSHQISTAQTSITLMKPASGFNTETDYYITFLPNNCEGGIELYFVTTDGVCYKAANSKQLFETAPLNKVKNLGTINYTKFPKANNYEIYQILGRNIKCSDATIDETPITINKSTYNDATLITNSSENKTINSTGVYFIDPEATGVTISGSAEKLVLVSLDNDRRATVSKKTQVALTITTEPDYLIMSGINFISGLTGPANIFGAAKSSESFEQIIFDNCGFELTTDNNLAYLQAPVTNIIFTNCDFKLHENGTKTDRCIISTNPTHTYKSFIFKNNIVYCAEGNHTGFRVFSNGNATMTSIEFSKNTFANVYPYSSNGYINSKSITTAKVVSNLFYLPKFPELITSAYVGILYVSDSNNNEAARAGYTFTSNLVYYNTTPSQYKLKCSYYGNDPDKGLYTKTGSDNPITSPDFTNGIFIQSDSYTSYGAQRTQTGTQSLSERQTWTGVSAWE